MKLHIRFAKLQTSGNKKQSMIYSYIQDHYPDLEEEYHKHPEALLVHLVDSNNMKKMEELLRRINFYESLSTSDGVMIQTKKELWDTLYAIYRSKNYTAFESGENLSLSTTSYYIDLLDNDLPEFIPLMKLYFNPSVNLGDYLYALQVGAKLYVIKIVRPLFENLLDREVELSYAQTKEVIDYLKSR